MQATLSWRAQFEMPRGALASSAQIVAASREGAGCPVATTLSCGEALPSSRESLSTSECSFVIIGQSLATLARERAICYASLCMVTNPAAGVGVSELSAQSIALAAASLSESATRVVLRAAAAIAQPRPCARRRAPDAPPPSRPNSPHSPPRSSADLAFSKLLDGFRALACFRERGVPVPVTRLFNIVGARQSGRYGMVLPRFLEAARGGGPIRVFGDGS